MQHRRYRSGVALAVFSLLVLTIAPTTTASPPETGAFVDLGSPELQRPPVPGAVPAGIQLRTYADGVVGPADGANRPPAPEGPTVDQPKVGPDGSITGGKILGQGAPALSATVNGERTAALSCPAPTPRPTLKLSTRTVPLTTESTVTVTLKDENGQPVRGAKIVLDGSNQPLSAITDVKGEARLTFTPFWSGVLRISAEGSTARPAFIYAMAKGQSAVEVSVRDRCGLSVDGDVWATFKRRISFGSVTGDSVAPFVTDERSALLEAFGTGASDGLPYFLNKQVSLSPGKVTSVTLSGEGLTPTTIAGQLDTTSLGGDVYLRSMAAEEGPWAYGIDLPGTLVATNGEYATMWLGNPYAALFKDSVRLKGGALSVPFRSRDIGTLTFSASVGETPVDGPSLSITHGRFGLGISSGQNLSAGRNILWGLWVSEVDGSASIFDREQPLPLTIQGGATATFAWNLAQGAPQVVTDPTYDQGENHGFRLRQRSADGWSLVAPHGKSPTYTLTNPENAEVVQTGILFGEENLYIPYDAPASLTLQIDQVANPYTSQNTLTTTLQRNVYQITPSQEILRPGTTTDLTVTLTKNGRPLKGERIDFWNPDGPSRTLTTDSRGAIKVRANPRGVSSYDFLWNHNNWTWWGHAYGLPKGWGLVQVNATGEDGRPLDWWNYQGTQGVYGFGTVQGEVRKAILPVGAQTVAMQGSRNHFAEGTYWQTPYLLTAPVTVSDGETVIANLSALDTIPLRVDSNIGTNEYISVGMHPDSLPPEAAQFSTSDSQASHVWQVTPGTYHVSVIIRNGKAGTTKIFPSRTSSGETLTFASEDATTELQASGVAEDGRAASQVSMIVTLGGGAGVRSPLGTRLLAAPGTYTVKHLHLQFTSGRTESHFIFDGAKEITVNGEASIPLVFGGRLTGSLTADQPTHGRGESVTFNATLTEQQGLTLTSLISGRTGGALYDYPGRIGGRGPATLSALPVDGKGAATWKTSNRTKTGLYTFTYNQDLLGYFRLPTMQTTVQIN